MRLSLSGDLATLPWYASLRCLPLLCFLASAGFIEPHKSGSGHEVATVKIQVPEEWMMDCRVLVENVAQNTAALVNDNRRRHRNMYSYL